MALRDKRARVHRKLQAVPYPALLCSSREPCRCPHTPARWVGERVAEFVGEFVCLCVCAIGEADGVDYATSMQGVPK